MRTHKEGTVTIIVVLIFLLIIDVLIPRLFALSSFFYSVLIFFSVLFFSFIRGFFRKPERNPDYEYGEVLSPCDGKVVVIEETEEPEYFHGRRIQVSIFMSPLNVHINYNPINGEVKYVQYHPGKHLVAFSPKSSLENERSTTVIVDGQREILIRQIAGTVARRIVTYSKVGQQVKAGDELGFIKFGSRVDLFFPPDSKIKVKLNDKVVGAESVIGQFPS